MLAWSSGVRASRTEAIAGESNSDRRVIIFLELTVVVFHPGFGFFRIKFCGEVQEVLEVGEVGVRCVGEA